jgi:hypothetical protein
MQKTSSTNKSLSSLNNSKTNLKGSSTITKSKEGLNGSRNSLDNFAKEQQIADIPPAIASNSLGSSHDLKEGQNPNLPSNTYYQERQLEGIIPLFLTSQSQSIVKCVIGEDVTTDRMFRMIPKADLMADMATRLAISDFTPAKPEILAYPRESMMLHYDPEYKYTQNFFLVVSPDTVDSILLV